MKMKYTGYLILPVLAVFFSGCAAADTYAAQTGYGAEVRAAEETAGIADSVHTDQVPAADDPAIPAGECVVHIGGEVRSPGVYRLAAGSRLIDAVEMAGGLTDEAESDGCNLAEVLTDGMHYRIPAAGETAESVTQAAGAASSYTADGRLDINRATPEELMLLSGIGQTRAQAIVSYREEHGAFRTAEEIKEVSGIGDAVFAAISGDITVR